MAATRNPRLIPTLDGWRTLAISLVFASHMGLFPRVAAGELGVDIFFGLSGYLICTLLLREKEAVGRIALDRFYARRAFRILPPALLYLGSLLALKFAGVIPDQPAWDVVAAAAFFRNYWYMGGMYTRHFWSLAVEEHFYLIIPLLLARTSRRTALIASVTLAAASVASRAFALDQPGDFGGGMYPTHRTENRFDGLFWGATLALALRDDRIKDRLTRALSPPVVAALAVLMVLLLKLTSSPALSRTVTAWFLPLFIASTVLRPTTWAGRTLDLAPVRWVGRLSYSLYLWQQLFLMEPGTRPVDVPLGRLQTLPLSLAATLACALASYYLVEKPMIRVGHRLAASPAAPPPGAPETPTPGPPAGVADVAAGLPAR